MALQQAQAEVWIEPCYYCGVAAESTDHAIPQVVIQQAMDSGDQALVDAVENRRRQMTVRACFECNSLARAVFDETLADRKARVKVRLRFRYARLLTIPDWHPQEFRGIDRLLQNRIIHQINQRDLLLQRLRW